MKPLSDYLFVAAVVAVLIAWSWRFHVWSNSATARRSRSPLSLGFTATAASALFLIAGITGFNLSQRGRFFSGRTWTGAVIWWEVLVGALLVPVAVYLVRRGIRDIDRQLRRV